MKLPALFMLACMLLGQRPPVEDAWDLLAKGARDDAVRLLNSILKTNPRDAEARLLLGSILAEDGKYSGAIPHIKEAVRLRPQSAEAHNALAEALNGSGDTAAARPEFEKAVQLDPKFAPARVSLGLALVEAGDFAAAAPHLDRALEILGNTEDAAFPHYLRAKIHTESGEVERAAEHLQKAVSMRPDFAEAWSDLGQARKALSDDAGALAAFRKAVDADPENSVAQYRLGAEYLHQGNIKPAVEHLEAAFRLNPKDQSTLYSLQLALREDGQLERAREIKEKLANLLRTRDKAYQNATAGLRLNNEGAALEKAGDLRGALEKYRAALELDPEHVGIRTNFAAVLIQLGRWQEGIAQLREALRRDPANQSLKKALADALAHAPPATRQNK
jgi:protein O-GlcNAc transferase